MNAQDLEEKRAREFLAAEYERDGKTGSADHIRTQPLLPNKARAVRAIAAALRQQPAPVDLAQFRLPVEAFLENASVAMSQCANPASEIERERHEAASADFDEAQRLLALIDSAGEVKCAEVSGCIATVPDKCDRIIWRGQYRHLPPHQPAPVVDDAMVERLARAWCDQTDTGFDALPEAGRQLCLHHMRIALTAALARAKEVQP